MSKEAARVPDTMDELGVRAPNIEEAVQFVALALRSVECFGGGISFEVELREGAFYVSGRYHVVREE